MILTSLAAATCLLGAACGSSGDDAGGGGSTVPFPAGAGIRQGLLLSQLETGGWVVCHEDTYADQGAPIADITSACAGPYLMLACRPSAATDALTLAAADARAVVLQPDAFSATAHHVANGVGWYLSDTASWGFFPAGEAVNRSPCDDVTTSSDRRLCWHASAAELSQGYRCGNPGTTAATWRRLVLTHP